MKSFLCNPERSAGTLWLKEFLRVLLYLKSRAQRGTPIAKKAFEVQL